MQPILLIESRAPGLLYVNGQFCGELTEPQPFPARPDARALIELRPLGHGGAADGLRADAARGARAAARTGGRILRAVAGRRGAGGAAAAALAGAHAGRAHGAFAGAGGRRMRRGGGALCATGSRRRPCRAARGSLCARALDGGALAVQGACDAGAFACVVPPPGGRIGEGAAALVTARIACAGRGRTCCARSWAARTPSGTVNCASTARGRTGCGSSRAQPVWAQGVPRWPQSAQETLRAYLEAVRLGLRAEAEGYLAAPHAAPALAALRRR